MSYWLQKARLLHYQHSGLGVVPGIPTQWSGRKEKPAELAKDMHGWEMVSECLPSTATQVMLAYLRVSLGFISLSSSSAASPRAGPTAFSGSA